MKSPCVPAERLLCARLAQTALEQITAANSARFQQRDLHRQAGSPTQWSADYRAAHDAANVAFAHLSAFSGAALCTLDGPLGALGQFRALQTQLRFWRTSSQPAARLTRDVIPASQLSTRLHQHLFPHSWAE